MLSVFGGVVLAAIFLSAPGFFIVAAIVIGLFLLIGGGAIYLISETGGGALVWIIGGLWLFGALFGQKTPKKETAKKELTKIDASQ